MNAIPLSKISEWLALATEGWKAYLNVDNGKIMTVSLDHLAIAVGLVRVDNALQENDYHDPSIYLSDRVLQDFSDSERHDIRVAYHLTYNSDRYKELPNDYDFSMLKIMESFALVYHDQSVRANLLASLSRNEAAGSFLRNLQNLGIEHEWCEARDAALRVIARDWCIDNHILFDED